jgi:hypothetical protein
MLYQPSSEPVNLLENMPIDDLGLLPVPQKFSNYLRMIKDKCAPVLGWSLSNPPKPHAFSSMPLQSDIFTFNRKLIISFVSSIITGVIGYTIKIIVWSYLDYQLFNPDNFIASLTYFGSLGGIRFVIYEYLKENTMMMYYCGDSMAVPKNKAGSDCLCVDRNRAGYTSLMQANSDSGIASSSAGGDSITKDRLQLQNKLSKVQGKIDYFGEQLQGAREDLH